MHASRLVAVLAVTLLIVGPVGAFAQEAVEIVEVDFSTDGGPPPGWSADPGDPGVWMFEGDYLYGSGHAWYRYTAHEWDDLDVAFSMQLSGGLHVNLRESAAGRYRLGILAAQGETFISIARSNDVVVESPPFETPEVFEVQASVKGGEVALTVAGRTLSWIDPNPLPPGTFGFESLEFTDPVFIDWVRLEGTRTAPPRTVVTTLPPPESRRDLAVEALEAEPVDASRIRVSALVTNTGTATVEEAMLFIESEGDPLDERTIADLAPGASVAYSETLTVFDHLVGRSFSLDAIVEPEDTQPDNNRATTRVQLPPPVDPPTSQRLPDLVVEGLEARAVDEGSVDVRGVVVNVGGSPAPPTTVAVAADGATIAELQIPSLEEGRSHGFGEIISLPVGAGGSIELSLTVDPAGRIDELAEGNNRASAGIALGVVPAGSPPWPILIGTGAVIVIAGSSLILRRRLVPRRWERSAEDEARRGRCNAGDEYTKRDCSKSLKPRKLVSVSATALDGAETPGAARDLNEVLPALRRALRCDRLVDEEGCAASLDRAAASLSAAVGEWTADLEAAQHVELSAAYEGSSADATFTRLRCDPNGRWPDPASAAQREIRGRWKGAVSDKATIELGRIEDVRTRPRSVIEAETRVLLERLIRTVSERRHPLPRGLDVEVKAEV